MKWIGERISFIEQPKKLTVVINPEDKFFQKGLMGAWFAMWLTIGGVMIWSLNTFGLNQQEKLIVVVFLCFWAYYAFKVGKALFWLIWGKELIKIEPDGFIYKKSIKGFGKSSTYFLENIERVEVLFPKENSIQAVWENSPWIQNAERIQFQYISKNIRFARKLNEKDANLLFKLITKKIEEYLKKR
ncbi:MAG: hypothetical protein ACK48V_11835 [Crocinitomicaceae bacterium]|jgi:hypothetical protein